MAQELGRLRSSVVVVAVRAIRAVPRPAPSGLSNRFTTPAPSGCRAVHAVSPSARPRRARRGALLASGPGGSSHVACRWAKGRLFHRRRRASEAATEPCPPDGRSGVERCPAAGKGRKPRRMRSRPSKANRAPEAECDPRQARHGWPTRHPAYRCVRPERDPGMATKRVVREDNRDVGQRRPAATTAERVRSTARARWVRPTRRPKWVRSIRRARWVRPTRRPKWVRSTRRAKQIRRSRATLRRDRGGQLPDCLQPSPRARAQPALAAERIEAPSARSASVPRETRRSTPGRCPDSPSGTTAAAQRN